MERIFNCTPSRRTGRDFPMLMEAGQELPYKHKPNEIEDLLNRIRYDQLSSSSCVGQALAKLKSISQYLQDRQTYQFSPWWAWMNRPNDLSFLFETEGSNLKNQAEKLVDDGIVFLSQYNLNPELKPSFISYKANKDKFLNEVRPALLTEARYHKADRYVFPATISEIKQAIVQFGAVAIAIPIYTSFYRVKSDGVIPIPNKNKEQLAGGHAMVLYGWDDDKLCWYGDNSYGSDWGNKGFFTMSYDFPVWEYVALADDTLVSWADRYFYALWRKGITLHERNFSKNITRAEVMAILARMLAGGEGYIKSGTEGIHWADKYYSYLNDNGVKVFEKRYDDNITRAEFMTLLYRCFADVDTLQAATGEHWAKVYFDALKKQGITIHEERFDDPITRAEVMALVVRALGLEV